jgi:DNA topoisomerase-3
MHKTLVIAEKPSMGRDIANALSEMVGSPVRNDGLCQHIGSYTVVGAQGHLFSLAAPDQYGKEFEFPWRVDVLPLLPEKFLLEPNYQREKGKVVNSSLTQSIRARLTKISELIKSADQVIHAGDPDREGQLIINDILQHFKFKGVVKRLWLHAQTSDGIQEALRTMKDNKDYTNLGVAALARRESDWAIGMNATRAFSAEWWKKGHKGVLNIGRVVTPVVGMIVQREKDIENFVPTNHFTLRAQINIGQNDPFLALWVKPEGEGQPEFDPSGKLIVDRRFVASVQAKCNGQPAKIITADKTAKRTPPPLLFSLVELQKAAANMGYSPDEVLTAAQALYEKHKLTSYPRTECQYAPESEHLKANSVMKAIANNFAGVWKIPDGWDVKRKSDAWNDKKLAEHFAIIPLSSSCPVGNLSTIERNVYRLVCRHYTAQFFPHYEYLSSKLIAQVVDETFKATGNTPTVEGWRTLYGGASAVKKKTGHDSDEQDSLPNVSQGDVGRADPVALESNQTSAPKRFTAITLLEAMEKAYLFVTNPKVRAKLRQVEGIGTAATRATIIARAVSTGLAAEDRTGKVISYTPTPKAFGYIMCVPEKLATPDLTAWFEGKLEDLSKGTLTYADYRVMLARLVDHVILTAKNGTAIQRMPRPEDMPEPVAIKKTRKRSAAPRATTNSKKSGKK